MLTLVEVGCMYTISINQIIKRIKNFDFFDFLINLEVTHTSYLKEGQCKTDIDDIVLGHMAIIPFPVLCECHNVSKRAMMTK